MYPGWADQLVDVHCFIAARRDIRGNRFGGGSTGTKAYGGELRIPSSLPLSSVCFDVAVDFFSFGERAFYSSTLPPDQENQSQLTDTDRHEHAFGVTDS